MTAWWGVAVATAAALGTFGAAAHAEVPLAGRLIARDACPALQSIRKGTNPGEVRLEPGRAYEITAKNRPAATHYRVTVEGAEPAARWVAVGCGEHVVAADGSTPAPTKSEGSASGQVWVLAVSWQPAFCEGHPDKTECATQVAGRWDADHFTLHGLWPQRVDYCHVAPEAVAADKNGKWGDLPEPVISAKTRQDLDRVMPGTASRLERHEWIKHGTCAPVESADDYFKDAIRLVDELNGSAVRTLFAQSIGREVTGAAVREAFDEAFGDGAGERVRIACTRVGGRNLVTELTLGLVGDSGAGNGLAALMAASGPTDPGCPAGIVDPVGRQ